MLGSSQARFSEMAIQQTKKQSDLEKRLRLLRHQVYGKTYSLSETNHSTQTPISGTSLKTDIPYLYQDLLKIGIFASIAIGIQAVLFILLKNHILNINLF